MAYIAFDLDALNKAPHVARALGCLEDTAIAGLTRLWAHCFRESQSHVTTLEVLGLFGVDAVPALTAFGFLEADQGKFRVKGADRYLAYKEGQKKGGLAAKKNLKQYRKKAPPAELTRPVAEPEVSRTPAGPEPEGKPDKLTGSTPALLPNTYNLLEKSGDFSLASEPKKGFENWQTAVVEIETTFEALRGQKFGWDGRAFKALKAIEKISDGNLSEVVRRWKLALQSTHPVVGELHEFFPRWNKFAAEVKPPTKKNFEIIGAENVEAPW